MAISFNQIPATVRVPLFYCEMDNSAAGTFSATYRTLLIGQALSADEFGKPAYVSSLAKAKAQYGNGSQLAQMVEG